MFCDGKCINEGMPGVEKKQCGLYYTITMYNEFTKKDEEITKCGFLHLADSQIRLERSMLGVERAVQRSKNRKIEDDHELSKVVATGMMGMMHAFTNDSKKFGNAMGILQEFIKRPLPEIEE